MLRHLLNFVLWIMPPSRMFAFRRGCLKLGGAHLGRNVSVCGRGWIYGRGKLQIGDDTWLSPGVIIYTHLDASIAIGASCDIGPGVEFITGSHDIGPASRRAGRGIALPIVVQDGCWIGAGAKILGGVVIGSGSIVAAGAVVTKSISPNVLVAGVPAAVKKELV